MAEPLSFENPPRDVRQEPHPQLQSQPDEHPEAMLDVYAILQLLRDKGILEMIKDGLGSMEKVMEIITETLEREEVVRTVRNLTIFVKMIGSIEPDTLERIMKSLSNATEDTQTKKPPGLLRLLGQFSTADARRALEPLAAALQAAGRSMPQKSNEERTHTTRHSA